jgi:hypothetical protein
MGDWLARGYLGYGDAMLGSDRIFLDSQSFPILGDVWDASRVERVLAAVRSQCVEPQGVGALALWPPMRGPLLEPGSDTNGGTWSAIDSWLAWAWSKHNPRAAWDFFLSTTLAARAEAYPDVWYGVWSGPDSYNAHYHPRPGETFRLNATPMIDYPIMNMNRHSGLLLGAIKLAGIEPRSGVLSIDPCVPFASFATRMPLVGFTYANGRHRGYYRPVVAGTFRFAVRSPQGVNPQEANLSLDGRNCSFDVDSGGCIRFESPGEPGDRITWEIS